MCKTIVKIARYFIFVIVLAVHTNAFAGSDQEREYLVQILNQLNTLKPLIVAAAKEQPKTNRFHFHYFSYRDGNGVKHNGLLEDINEIQKGIEARLNKIPSEPHSFSPIVGDYISRNVG